MALNRREFLSLVAAGVATGLLVSSPLARAATRPKIKAIAFDGFTTFDPRPVFALTEALFPGHGAELSNAWRTRQFEYAWLRTLTGRYLDFWHVTEDALVFSAKMLKLELSPEKRRQLMHAYLEIKAWPDALPALRSLKDAGIRMAFLSNLTAAMLDAAVKNSGLDDIFEPHLSTDRVRAYKPDPRAYQMGIDAFGLRRDQIAFAAFGGWDAAGAKSFGYPTFWVNRMNLPVEELGVAPDAIGASLHELKNLPPPQNLWVLI
ncbi:MAG: haloacid dehalogenase type II [Gammaproteobacteria bacterium]